MDRGTDSGRFRKCDGWMFGHGTSIQVDDRTIITIRGGCIHSGSTGGRSSSVLILCFDGHVRNFSNMSSTVSNRILSFHRWGGCSCTGRKDH